MSAPTPEQLVKALNGKAVVIQGTHPPLVVGEVVAEICDHGQAAFTVRMWDQQTFDDAMALQRAALRDERDDHSVTDPDGNTLHYPM